MLGHFPHIKEEKTDTTFLLEDKRERERGKFGRGRGGIEEGRRAPIISSRKGRGGEIGEEMCFLANVARAGCLSGSGGEKGSGKGEESSPTVLIMCGGREMRVSLLSIRRRGGKKFLGERSTGV